MKFVKKFTVNSHDTDFNGVSRASCMLRYFQEAANLQLEEYGPTYDQLRSIGRAFVLSRVAMSVYAPLHAYDEIEVETWGCESRAASFYRCGRIYKNGVIVAEIISIWACIDVETKRLLRVSDVNIGFSTEEMLELDVPAKFRIPEDVELSLAGEYTVGYGVTDGNLHMNNTFYPDMLCDHIPDMNGKRVIAMSISFQNEAKLGETFKVYTSKDDGEGKYYFRTMKRGGKVGIEAEMLLDEI